MSASSIVRGRLTGRFQAMSTVIDCHRLAPVANLTGLGYAVLARRSITRLLAVAAP